jgi:hypothetical protein
MRLLLKLGTFLLWTLVFVAIVLATDQFFVRFNPRLPVLAEVRAFYVDFRARLLGLEPTLPRLPEWATPAGSGKPAPSPPADAPARPDVPEPPPKKPAAAPAAKAAAPAPLPAGGAGYVYADERGELRFAATLGEIPPALRAKAQPLAR